MKKQFYMICVILLTSAAGLLTGCAATGATQEEVHRRHVDTWSTQKLQLQDDIDAWLMIDRPPRTSRAYIR